MMVEEEKPRKRKVWTKILVWFGIVIFIAATLGANIYQQRTETAFAPETLKTATVKSRTMNKKLIAAGEVEPAKVAKIYLDPSKGNIAEVFVQQGDKVKKGDKLLSYDGSQLSAQKESLDLKIKAAHMQVDHRNSQISDLEGRISEVEGQISDAEDKNAPDSVMNQLKQQKNQLESQKEDLAFQNQLSQIDLKQDNLQIQQVQDQMENLVVRAAMGGVVQSVAGEPYNGQEAIVTVISDQPYEIHGTLTEYDAVHVKKGQTVSIQAKAINGKQWTGTVTKVGKTPIVQQQAIDSGQQQSVTSYPFTITLKGDTSELRAGYHVNAEIIVDQHKDVPAVPINAILTQGNQSYVFVVKNGKLDRRSIQTDFVNGNDKEVTKGVKVDDKIVLHPTDHLKEGMVIPHDKTQ